MDWDAIQANWKRLIPLAKDRWSECSDDELENAAGDQEALDTCIALHYDITEQEARHQTQEWGLRLVSIDSDVKPKPGPWAGLKVKAPSAVWQKPPQAPDEPKE